MVPGWLLLLLAGQVATGTAAEPAPSDELAGELAQDGALGLDIYGFLDFGYSKTFTGRRSVISDLVQRDSFAVGSFNLYLHTRLSPMWRSLAEVQFLYAPNGSDVIDLATGAASTTRTEFNNSADLGTLDHWGGIKIQRAWLECDLHPLLKLRGGQWLTPVGIWNVDHGSPTIIGVHAPFVTRLELFPSRQTGLSASGQYDLAEQMSLSYELTLSNGRGPFDTHRDFDGNKAIGGRLVYTLEAWGRLAVGASAYYGRSTDAELRITLDRSGGIPKVRADILPKVQYDELALGADLRWEYEGFLVQAELSSNQRRYTEDGRPPAALGLPGLVPDHTQRGGYLVMGYRFELLGLMPFVTMDWLQTGYPDFSVRGGNSVGVGLNVRPHPTVVLKVQYVRYNFRYLDVFNATKEEFDSVDTQAAWVF